jgi:hypothetical protein
VIGHQSRGDLDRARMLEAQRNGVRKCAFDRGFVLRKFAGARGVVGFNRVLLGTGAS